MKLHPLSIPYRSLEGWSRLAGGLVFLSFVTELSLSFTVVAALALLVPYAAWEAAYYKRFVFALSAGVLEIRSGVVSRREREIPVRRIQNLNINRNLLQRVLGIATVGIETAGGQATEARLRYVGYPEARDLQEEIRRLQRAQAEQPDAEPSPGIEDDELFRLDPQELTILCLASFDARILGFLLFTVPFIAPSVPWRRVLPNPLAPMVLLAAALLLALASWATGALATFVKYHGFRLSRRGDDLRIERGLLSRYEGSIPTDKIQALTLQDNPLKRALGYATLKIETAGYAPQQTSQEGTLAAVPLARRERALELARTIDPFEAPELEAVPRRSRTRYAIRYAVLLTLLAGLLFAAETTLGTLPGLGQTWVYPLVLVPLAPLAAHLKWEHLGYALTPEHLVTRQGFWNRQTKIVPCYRVQNAISRQTLLQRRWNLATVTADTAGSFGLAHKPAQALDLDAKTAETLRERIHENLQEALHTQKVQELLADEIGQATLRGLEGDPPEGPAGA